jgi:hypothetical protein
VSRIPSIQSLQKLLRAVYLKGMPRNKNKEAEKCCRPAAKATFREHLEVAGFPQDL